MHIEFVPDEHEELEQYCPCCLQMFQEVEEFLNEYKEIVEEETFSLEYMSEMLLDFYQTALETGKQEAFEQIAGISANLAYPTSDKCECSECCEACDCQEDL